MQNFREKFRFDFEGGMFGLFSTAVLGALVGGLAAYITSQILTLLS